MRSVRFEPSYSQVRAVTRGGLVQVANVGIDLWTAPDADPCEVRLTGDAGGLPEVIEVRRGTEPFATLRVAGPDAAGGGP